jgi:RNA polymerase sigma factor (TIGR02999 family)
MPDAQTQITELLHAWRADEPGSLPKLTELVYAQLRQMASNRLGRSHGSTLTPTALVHEAFLRLCDTDIDWRDRAHFFALAALHMRNVLVDHARSQQASKRGGDQVQVTLTGALAPDASSERAADILVVDQALRKLEAEDARTGKVIELTYFGGLNRDEVAHVLDISVPTVDRAAEA